MSFIYSDDEDLAREMEALFIEDCKKRERQLLADEKLALELVTKDNANRAKQTCNDERPAISYLEKSIQFKCPHCGLDIIVDYAEFNCRIFRCGSYIVAGDIIQFPQHAGEAEIMALIDQAHGDIIGCGRPFKIDGDLTTRSLAISKAGWDT
jgi:hypothetical protein